MTALRFSSRSTISAPGESLGRSWYERTRKALAGTMALAIYLRKTGLPHIYRAGNARQPTPEWIDFKSVAGARCITCGDSTDRTRYARLRMFAA